MFRPLRRPNLPAEALAGALAGGGPEEGIDVHRSRAGTRVQFPETSGDLPRFVIIVGVVKRRSVLGSFGGALGENLWVFVLLNDYSGLDSGCIL